MIRVFCDVCDKEKQPHSLHLIEVPRGIRNAGIWPDANEPFHEARGICDDCLKRFAVAIREFFVKKESVP